MKWFGLLVRHREFDVACIKEALDLLNMDVREVEIDYYTDNSQPAMTIWSRNSDKRSFLRNCLSGWSPHHGNMKRLPVEYEPAENTTLEKLPVEAHWRMSRKGFTKTLGDIVAAEKVWTLPLLPWNRANFTLTA